MSQKQLNPTNNGVSEFGPQQLGNKDAKDAADKAKAALDAVYVDQDALLLAERNDVLDAAIARLGENAERWIVGDLARGQYGHSIDLSCVDTSGGRITLNMAELLRKEGHKFCLVGAVGAEYGPHSYEAVNAAIASVAFTLRNSQYGDFRENEGYGFSRGGVFMFNDSQSDGTVVVQALKDAKSLPLIKS